MDQLNPELIANIRKELDKYMGSKETVQPSDITAQMLCAVYGIEIGTARRRMKKIADDPESGFMLERALRGDGSRIYVLRKKA